LFAFVEMLIDAMTAAVTAAGVLFAGFEPAAILGGDACTGGVTGNDDFAAMIAPGLAGMTPLRTSARMMHGVLQSAHTLRGMSLEVGHFLSPFHAQFFAPLSSGQES
jgi:hypothetical protein